MTARRKGGGARAAGTAGGRDGRTAARGQGVGWAGAACAHHRGEQLPARVQLDRRRRDRTAAHARLGRRDHRLDQVEFGLPRDAQLPQARDRVRVLQSARAAHARAALRVQARLLRPCLCHDWRGGLRVETEGLDNERLLFRPFGLNPFPVVLIELRNRQRLRALDRVVQAFLLLPLQEFLEVRRSVIISRRLIASAGHQVEGRRIERRRVDTLGREEAEGLRVGRRRVPRACIVCSLAGLALDLLDVPPKRGELGVGLDLRLQLARAL